LSGFVLRISLNVAWRSPVSIGGAAQSVVGMANRSTRSNTSSRQAATIISRKRCAWT
jgi:hypothetical protein